MGKMLIAAYR